MSRILAYKGYGNLIPVDDAKIIAAYRCPWTDQVFDDRKEYANHLRSFRTHHIHRKIRANLRQKVFEELTNQPDFDSIIKWIKDNPKFMLDEYLRYDRFRVRDKDIPKLYDEFCMEITFLDLRYTDCASNSHACPRGGVTNWTRRDRMKDGTPAPTGYPGFEGRIEFKFSHDTGFGTGALRALGIHTGTGGSSGNERYGFGVTFFLSDWSGLEKSRMVGILKEKPTNLFHYGQPRYFRS